MSIVAGVACVGLIIAAVIFLATAFDRSGEGITYHPQDRGKRIFKWSGAAVSCAGLVVCLFVFVYMPGIVGDRITEAEDLTRKTFREKVGRLPDSIRFEPTDVMDGGSGWRYKGVAQCGAEVWDVTVTRSNDHAAKKTSLMCEAVPRR